MELFKAQNVASKIITKQEISKLKFLYQKQQERIEKRLQYIEEGANFGYRDGYGDGYYPSKLIKILDRETGYIRFLEPSINKTHEDSVINVYIDGVDKI